MAHANLYLPPALNQINGLTPSNDDIIQRKAGVWANRTMAQLLVDLGSPIPTRPNVAFNSDFAIFQRQLGTESTETSYSDDAYAWDRWYALTQTASVQCSRQSGDRAKYAARIKQNQASAQRAGMATLLEGIDSRPFRSQSIRAQVRVKISNSQAVRIAILEWTGTEDSPVSDCVNDWTSSTYTTGNFFKSTTTTVVGVAAVTPGAATWTDLSVSGTVSSSCTNLLVLVWSEGTMAQNVTLDVTQVSITRGTEERTWEPPDPSVEFRRCVHGRGYYRFQPAGGVNCGPLSKAVAGWLDGPFIQFPAPFSIVPTQTNSGPSWVTGAPSGNQLSAYNATGAADFTITGALTLGALPSYSFAPLILLAGTSFSGTVGSVGHLRYGGSFWVAWSADL